MPLGEGYFINLNNYEIRKIYEHHRDVANNPEVYGLTKKDIPKEIDTPENRKDLLIKVMKKGWARIRIGRNSLSYEGYAKWDDLIAGLIVFCNKMNIPGHQWVYVADLRTNKIMEDTVGNIINENIPDEYRGAKFASKMLIALRELSKRSILRSAKCSKKVEDKQMKLMFDIIKNYTGKGE